MILASILCLLSLAGITWCVLIASREGLGEPIRMIGRWLIAFADTLEDTKEFAMQRFGETHNDLRAQFPASRPKFSNRELTSISATPDIVEQWATAYEEADIRIQGERRARNAN